MLMAECFEVRLQLGLRYSSSDIARLMLLPQIYQPDMFIALFYA